MAQQLVNGLFLGSVYALFALGYTLIFGILDILNLAHAAIFMLGAFAALVVVLRSLVRRTRLGAAMRAVAENERAARVLGIDVERTIVVSFAIASALGGAAGVLYGLAFNSISPDMGQSIELRGLTVIIVG